MSNKALPQPPPEDNNEDDNNEAADYNLDIGYDQEFDDYVPEVGSRTVRGRKAMNELFKLVSSKLSRDIVRKNQYMPGQFEIWNKKKSGGNKKYVAGYEDYDNDGIKIEYVVRKKNPDGSPGPIIAVNGYSTTKSDWAARDKFYTDHPTRASRKGMNVKSYMEDEYYKPVYAENGMDIESYSIDPESDEFTEKYKKLYNLHTVKEKSPFRAIGDKIVFPVIKEVFMELAQNNEDKAKLYRKVVVDETGMKAFETQMLADFYDINVKDKLLESLGDKRDAIKQTFVTLRKEKDPNFQMNWDYGSDEYKDFERWLFAKKGIKKLIKQYVTPLLTTKLEDTKNKLKTSMINYIRHKIPDIDAIVNGRYRDFLNHKKEKYNKYQELW